MTVDRYLIAYLGLIAMSFVLSGCFQDNPLEADQVRISKEHAMELSKKEMASTTIPPIDAAVPDEFQTASFGLG